MNRAQRRRDGGKARGGQGQAASGVGAGEESSALMMETFQAARDRVWDAAHRLMADGRDLGLGVSKPMAMPAAAVVVDDGRRDVAAAYLPANIAVELLESIADALEGHGFDPVDRHWREEQPQGWAAVKARRERQRQAPPDEVR